MDLVDGRLESAAVSGVDSTSGSEGVVASSDACDGGSEPKMFQTDMRENKGDNNHPEHSAV